MLELCGLLLELRVEVLQEATELRLRFGLPSPSGSSLGSGEAVGLLENLGND